MGIYIENFETVFGLKSNVQVLRNKVLELAIQGKLVEQDPTDESASLLVKRVKDERNKLVKDGKIKKQKPLAPIEENEIPFEIPASWEWARMQDVADTRDFSFTDGPFGSDLKKEHYTDSGVRIIQLSNIGEGVWRDENKKFTSSNKADELIRCNAFSGDLVIAKMMPAGRTCKIPDINQRYILASDSVKYRPHRSLLADYVMYVLNTPIIRSCISDNTAGITRTRTSLGKLKVQIIPIPPLAEQHRIVTQIEFLMSKIDKFEELIQQKEHVMKLLPKAVVDAIGSCQTSEKLKEQLQFVIDNFETVFQTPESMHSLRNVIFQLAIEGKLVPQDIADESASELIKRIKIEKNRLVKEGKIKQQKPLEPIEEDEIPFEIPESWEWVRLEDISLLITKGSSPKWQGVSYTDKEEILFVTSENVGNNKLLMDKKKYVESKFNEIEPRSILNQNDILMNIVGASIGRTAIYDLVEVANINQAVCLIRILYDYIDLNYLLKFFNSVTCIGYMFDKQVDNARANLSMSNIAKFLIPIPPQAEQHRIVAKVESIMNLIDQMELGLKRKVDLVEKMASV